MARYILQNNIALRSWSDIPYACCVRGKLYPRTLSKNEFLTMLRCDGTEELDTSPVLEKLLTEGLIREAASDVEALSSWQEYEYFGNDFFPFSTLEITERCNYNCRHCFNAADSGAPSAELSFSEIERVLDELRACGVQNVKLTGGEPTLRPDFPEIVRAIREKELYLYSVNTNGAFLTEECLKLIRENGFSPIMKISFDGIGFHDWMRGRAHAEERTLEAIRRCIARGFCVMVQMNMNRRNLDTILPSLDHLEALGVWRTRLIRTTEAPRWDRQAGGDCLSWKEYFDRSLEIAKSYAGDKRSMLLDFWMFLTLDVPGRSFRCEKIRSADDGAFLNRYICRDRIDIGADGALYPCLQMSGWMKAHGICLGSLKERPLKELLRDSEYAGFIDHRVRDKAEANAQCAACPVLPYCRGGCPAVSILTGGGPLDRDEASCIFFGERYYERIKAAFPDFHDQSPMPENLNTAYLNRITGGLGAEQRSH